MVSELRRSETLKREFGTGAVLARHTICSHLLGLAPGATQVTTSKQTWYLMSTETIRLIRDGEKGGGLEVGEEGEYIPIAILSPPE